MEDSRSMSNIESVETEHGEVEYETFTCVSCGETFQQSDVHDVVTGDLVWAKPRIIKGVEMEFDAGYTRGYICDECLDNPNEYPHKPENIFKSFVFDVFLAINILLFFMQVAFLLFL